MASRISHAIEYPRLWFAAQVWAGREPACAARLTLRGYEVFLPCFRESRRWSDRVKLVEKALFPGYVFLRVPAETVGNIVTTPGVVGIVSDGEHPAAIPTHEIEALQRIVTTRLSATPWPYLHAGCPVRIEVGPLRDTRGILVRTKAGSRLIVSVGLLRRSVSVEIDASWVTVLPEGLLTDSVPGDNTGAHDHHEWRSTRHHS